MFPSRKPYGVYSHDGWGNTCVGECDTLAQAEELFRALRVDHWFLNDGSVKGISLVEHGDGGRTLESFACLQG
jgi:hypothetical protein